MARKIINSVLYKITFVAIAWVIGFFIFFISIPESKRDTENIKTDAIIVLTGGSMRLDAGLRLFEKLEAQKILISGVGGNVTKSQILNISSKLKRPYDINLENIVLGDIADSTFSNAIEAKIFMDLNKFKSFRLVTSTYHMPRSAIIFNEYLSDYEILQHPVGLDKYSIIQQGNYKLIINEYNKFLGAVAYVLWLKYNKLIGDIFSYFE